MAVDKKSDHVGNHEGRYVDLTGQTKQFTYIDHDIKPSMSPPLTKDDFDQARDFNRNYRPNLVDKILELSPLDCPVVFVDFTLRGERASVDWNETMLRDEGVPIEKLQAIYNMTSNKSRLRKEGLI